MYWQYKKNHTLLCHYKLSKSGNVLSFSKNNFVKQARFQLVIGMRKFIVFAYMSISDYLYPHMQQLSLFEQMQLLQEDKREVVIDEAKLTKVYYTITEVAEMFHVNASLLRFWEKEFPNQLANVKKNKKGDRYYNKADIANLKLLFHLVKEKRMTLEGAREHLKNNKKKVKDDKTLVENLEKIREFLLDLKKNIH
jgi:DNA-binding transcriptional MerR regulator